MILEDRRLKDVKLNKCDNGYTLTLTYKGKDDKGNVHEVVIHDMPLPIYSNTKYISSYEEIKHGHFDHCHQDIYLNIGYGSTLLNDNTKIVDKIVEYAAKEMTIEEIEKELGHKVKIVGEKENNDGKN